MYKVLNNILKANAFIFKPRSLLYEFYVNVANIFAEHIFDYLEDL